MSRTYEALQKSGGLTAFDPDASTNGRLDAGPGLPDIAEIPPRDITKAVEDLVHNKLLTHRFGVQGEWEVRTTFSANPQAWRYRSRVLVHGQEVRQDFPSINRDWARHIQRAEAVSEDMLAAFAREALEVHFARCSSVAEYIRMASVPVQHRRWQARLKRMALVLCGVVALVTAYWLWKGSEPLRPEPPPANQPAPATQPAPTPQPERMTPIPRLPGHWTW